MSRIKIRYLIIMSFHWEAYGVIIISWLSQFHRVSLRQRCISYSVISVTVRGCAIALSLGTLLLPCSRTRACARSRGIEVKNVCKRYVRALRTRIHAQDRRSVFTCCNTYELPASGPAHLFSSETGVRERAQSRIGYIIDLAKYPRKRLQIEDLKKNYFTKSKKKK